MLTGYRVLGLESPGPVLDHYQERSTPIISACYSKMLPEKLKPEIQRKCRGLLSKVVLLLHDYTRPHIVGNTAKTLQKLNFEVVLPHPPYTPDLASSDYHLFGSLKKALRGRQFTLDKTVKEAVHSWLASQPKIFFFL